MMPVDPFQAFMDSHPPVGQVVAQARTVLWEQSALEPVVKERMRIALAEAVGCAYCARARTDLNGLPILENGSQVDRKGLMAEAFATAIVANEATDEMTIEMQREFTPAEFADLVFSIGWFVGMQHVGRLMHWDDACPVGPIRALVEQDAAR